MTGNENIVFFLGTRPEIIKLAPVIRAATSSSMLDPLLVHTDQHYDTNMSSTFFTSLNLNPPDEHLDVGSGSQAQQTADGLVEIERYIKNKDPDVVIAQGDTNAVLSTSLAASKLDTKLGHVEAGIRSGDKSMPEEINRIITDHVSDFLFAPTDEAVDNLNSEGVYHNIYNTGNTILDSCKQHKEIAETESNILEDLNLSPREYVTTTIHRQINTEEQSRLLKILKSLDSQDIPVILPCHPRTKSKIKKLEFSPSGSLSITNALGYLDFLKLEANSRLIVTDSGGVQEEASILEIPCLTVRPNTERPETINAGVNKLVDPDKLERLLQELISNPGQRNFMKGEPHLYGRGNSGEEIVEIIENELFDS